MDCSRRAALSVTGGTAALAVVKSLLRRLPLVGRAHAVLPGTKKPYNLAADSPFLAGRFSRCSLSPPCPRCWFLAQPSAFWQLPTWTCPA